MKTIIDCYKSQGRSLYICFVDLKKAFDTVFRDGLIYKLQRLNVSSKFIKVISSMYGHVTARIKTKKGLTDAFPIDVGTRQGCNLSPTLFNIFINDLPLQLLHQECDYIDIGQGPFNCLMYADDLVIFSRTDTGMQNCLHKLETYCNRWRLLISVKKTKIIIINSSKKKECHFRVYKTRLEVVKSYCYLGIIISDKGDFKIALERLYNKASRAYFSLRKDFNFHSNTSPKVILKLFDSMIKPILLYGSEIWAIFGWKQNNFHNIQKYLFNDKHKFEALHIKMCRNILGVHKKATEIMVRSELGRYPLMSNILQNIYRYWQHLLNMDETSLVYNTLKIMIEKDRQGQINYYSRLKGLLTVMNSQEFIHKTTKSESVRNSHHIRTVFQTKFTSVFFRTLEEKANRQSSGGRFEIYDKVKKQYKFENYLLLKKNNLRRNITNIRISTHNLPIEVLRKSNIERNMRKCTLCDTGAVGSEVHVLMLCQNPRIQQLRLNLDHNINKVISQWKSIPDLQKFIYLVSAVDENCNFYFAVFLEKVFKEISLNKCYE
jgi:ribosomal protein S24E